MARVSRHPILEIPDHDTVTVYFEGSSLDAVKGEMISSTLFSHGIRTFGLHPHDASPQGIFCANGQCAQCMVIADGKPVKACMTPVLDGMKICALENLPNVPDISREDIDFSDIEEIECDLLIAGAGPSGLGAAIEAARAGLSVIVVDDKDRVGGKLVLQTHTFFGSVKQCHAGTRGIDIARILADEASGLENITIMTSTMVVGVYSDGSVGIVQNDTYRLVKPASLLVATGAREKALVFPGCDLPGVYGAGAFQTLLNRDLVKPSEKLFIVGGGNVGLIAAYHALQAGISVVGLIEGLSEVGGYWVHADKIRRLGVPVYTSTTVVSANGSNSVESVTVAEVDEKWNIKDGTFRTYPCDTLLIAVGLDPVNEIYNAAIRFGMDAYLAGDAEEIAEASAAMFSGRTAGRTIAAKQGRKVEIPDEWIEMTSILKSKPGRECLEVGIRHKGKNVFPVFWCAESIPCNPCMEVCPHGSIIEPEGGSILSRAEFSGSCRMCGKCVSACPGLAITIVDRRMRESGMAHVTLPHEMPVDFGVGDRLTAVGHKGEFICEAEVVEILDRQGRAPCSSRCPAGVRAQGYIELLAKGKPDDAMELLRQDLPLPAVCSRVCYAPCEEVCARAEVDEPVSILALKRFVTDHALNREKDPAALPIVHDEKVAVVGSGPAGLACASELARRGYGATVFEAEKEPGGMLRYGIPSYRLPRDILDTEIDYLMKLGIEIRTNHRIDDINALLTNGYGSVFIAAGAPSSSRLGIRGEDLGNINGAIEFLHGVNDGTVDRLDGVVAVIGGGNSAIDAARCALRLGASRVTVLYRRSREEMPAHDFEIDEAVKEGVKFEFLASPVEATGTDSGLDILRCIRMELGEPDESGRRRPVPVKNSEFDIPVDMVITATGQQTVLGNIAGQVGIDRANRIKADSVTQQTDIRGVFAGGDVVTGPATVVDAFGAGKRAAESIDRFLRGEDIGTGRNKEPAVSKVKFTDDIEPCPGNRPSSVPVKDREGNFNETVLALSSAEAGAEADRCLGCGIVSETTALMHNRISEDSTVLVTLAVNPEMAEKIAGIRIQDESVCMPVETVMPPENDDDVIVCRCERVTLGQIRSAIRAGVRDMNQLKAMLKTGLGACGGKTCGPLIQSIFRREGVSPDEVTQFTERPLLAETPMGLFAGARRTNSGGDR